VCDWNTPEVQHIWQEFHAEDLEETIRQNLRGGVQDDVSE